MSPLPGATGSVLRPPITSTASTSPRSSAFVAAIRGYRGGEAADRVEHAIGLTTLAGARRKLEEETTLTEADAPVIDELIGRNAKERLTDVKRGLRQILEMLAAQPNGTGHGADFRLTPKAAAPARRAVVRVSASRGKASKGKTVARRPAPADTRTTPGPPATRRAA